MTALSTLGMAFLSALFPFINIEAWMAGVGYLADSRFAWLAIISAGFGQTAGKTIWYYAGKHATHWRWLERQTQKPKWKERHTKVQTLVSDRPTMVHVIMFASALIGIPPLAVTSILAGQLRYPLFAFLVVTFTGRTLRFAAALWGGLLLQYWGAFTELFDAI